MMAGGVQMVRARPCGNIEGRPEGVLCRDVAYSMDDVVVEDRVDSEG